MARLMLVSVDDNEKALKLMARLDGVDGVKTIGLYGQPTQFCDGTCQAGNMNAKSVHGKKFGWRMCPVCRKTKTTTFGYLRNLLEMENLPAVFKDCFLTIKWPYNNDPVEKYGQQIIDTKMAQLEETGARIAKWRRREPARARRKARKNKRDIA